MTSIFKGTKKPDFGEYYITNGITDPNQAINSIVTVTDTKVIFQTIYKNEQYQKKEFTDIKILSVNTDIYVIEKINMGNYLVSIGIDTNQKDVFTEYRDINLKNPQTNFSKEKGIMPPNFTFSYHSINGLISRLNDLNEKATHPPTTTPTTTTTTPKLTPKNISTTTTPKLTPKNISTTTKPTTPEKSFLDEYLIYIVLVVLFLSAVATGVFVFIRNRNRMISKNKLIV
jgi:CxxC motif-containing protein